MTNKKIVFISICAFVIVVTIVIMYMCMNNFTTAETGTIGDGFNGLLAPFISFVGALLVYLSFKEQIKANSIISSQWTFDLHLRMLDGVRTDFDKIKVYVKNGGSYDTLYGNDAIIAVYVNWDNTQRVPEALSEFEIVTKELIFLTDKIIATKIENKDYLLNKILLVYSNSYEEAIKEFISFFEKKPNYNYASLVKTLTEVKNKVDLLKKLKK